MSENNSGDLELHRDLYHMCCYVQTRVKGPTGDPLGIFRASVTKPPLVWLVSEERYSVRVREKTDVVVAMKFIRGNTVVYAFRGSKGFDEWVHNLGFAGGYWSLAASITPQVIGLGELASVCSTASITPKRVIFAGASMGGALASIIARQQPESAIHTVKVVTFGAPAVLQGGVHYAATLDPIPRLGPLLHHNTHTVRTLIPPATLADYVYGHAPLSYWRHLSGGAPIEQLLVTHVSLDRLMHVACVVLLSSAVFWLLAFLVFLFW